MTLLHPELSYKIRGILLDVHNSLGPMLPEAYYESAISIALQRHQIQCETQKAFEVYYEGARVGLYYVDVWIEDGKIIVEVKVAPAIEPIHKAQALSYLRVTNADLAILANFGARSLEDERLPNFLRDRRAEFAWHDCPLDEGSLYPTLTLTIMRACHKVHFVLGPGFLHQVYRRATMVELSRSNVSFRYIKQLPVEYEGHLLGVRDTRLIFVEDKVLLATFALQRSDTATAERLKACMRHLHVNLGILANFHGTKLSITAVRIK